MEDKVVKLSAVGDVLPHGRVYGGINKKSNYNFDNLLSNAKELFDQSDITIANLESIIAGHEFGLSSYPKFNGPTALGYSLKNLGVNMVNIANNHVLDKGEKGLRESISKIEEIGLEYVGAYKSYDDHDRLRIQKVNGLRICFVSYTRGTNSIKVPNNKPYLVNSLKNINLLKILKDLRTIKNNNMADVIVANMHFGEEYHLYPSSYQREVARSLADAGADIILGHHPHVLQPPEWIETSHGTESFVAYSLGNFFSGQNGLYRQIGAVLSLDITKPSDHYDHIKIANPHMKLTFVNREESKKYKLYTLSEWIEQNEFIETAAGKFDSRSVFNQVANRLKNNISDLSVE